MEAVRVEGDRLLEQVKHLLFEGNIRRIVIKEDGRVVVEFPLSAETVGAAATPVLASVGVLGALLTECTIEVERTDAPRRRADASVEEITDEAAAVRWGSH